MFHLPEKGFPAANQLRRPKAVPARCCGHFYIQQPAPLSRYRRIYHNIRCATFAGGGGHGGGHKDGIFETELCDG